MRFKKHKICGTVSVSIYDDDRIGKDRIVDPFLRRVKGSDRIVDPLLTKGSGLDRRSEKIGSSTSLSRSRCSNSESMNSVHV